MRTILVTGSTGYVGRHLIRRLQRRFGAEGNFRIFGLSRHGDPDAQGWTSYAGDLLLPDLPRLLEELQPDVIFHTASTPPHEPLEEQMRTHVMGTRHLLQALVDTQVDARVVIPGSCAEYGHQPEPVTETTPLQPDTEHAISKIAQTHLALHYVNHYQLDVVIGRVFHVYGLNPNSKKLIASLAAQLVRFEKAYPAFPKLHVRNLWAERDFIHIEDAADALITLAEKGRAGNIYNISANQAIPVQELVDILLRYARVRHVEVVASGDKKHDFCQGRSQKITAHTGWKPHVSLEDGLKKELDFWRKELVYLLPDEAYVIPTSE